jgi:Cys-tRNA(Pro) deacylase
MSPKFPMTAAIRFLKEHEVEYTPHLYKYQEKGGTAVSSRELGVPENIVIKTLVMERDDKQPLIVLMHGDKQVSTKELARVIGVKTVSPCKPEVADRHSGYQVGGTSPFGTRKPMPIYMEKTIADLERIFINGGGRGFLVSLDPKEIVRVLNPQLVTVAIEQKDDR